MGIAAARLLLPLRGTRARAALIAMVAFAATACVLPPDGRDPAPTAAPPEIDFSSLRPSDPAPVIRILRTRPAECRFEFSARIRDRDTNILRTRWVANNTKSTVTFLDEGAELIPRDASGEGTWKPTRISLTWPIFGEGNRHTVSLFVIEADEGVDWLVSEQEAASPEPGVTPNDFGALRRLDDAGQEATVVEARWFLEFEDGECGS